MTTAARGAIVILAAALIAGCSIPKVEGEPNDALLPRQPAASAARTPGRVALLIPPEVLNMVYESDKIPAVQVRLHVGRIVAAALSAALDEAFEGGVSQVDQVPSAHDRFDAMVHVDAVRVQYRQALAWFVPLPPFGLSASNYYAQLTVDLRLLDERGNSVRAMSYDSGSVLYQTSSSPEPMPQGVLRIAHEQAWQVAQRLIADLRPWLATERNKPREL